MNRVQDKVTRSKEKQIEIIPNNSLFDFHESNRIETLSKTIDVYECTPKSGSTKKRSYSKVILNDLFLCETCDKEIEKNFENCYQCYMCAAFYHMPCTTDISAFFTAEEHRRILGYRTNDEDLKHPPWLCFACYMIDNSSTFDSKGRYCPLMKIYLPESTLYYAGLVLPSDIHYYNKSNNLLNNNETDMNLVEYLKGANDLPSNLTIEKKPRLHSSPPRKSSVRKSVKEANSTRTSGSDQRGSVSRKTTRTSSSMQQKVGAKTDDTYGVVLCQECGLMDVSLDNIIICDGCEDEFHMSCLDIKQVPQGEWYCHSCEANRTPLKRGMPKKRKVEHGLLVKPILYKRGAVTSKYLTCSECKARYSKAKVTATSNSSLWKCSACSTEKEIKLDLNESDNVQTVEESTPIPISPSASSNLQIVESCAENVEPEVPQIKEEEQTIVLKKQRNLPVPRYPYEEYEVSCDLVGRKVAVYRSSGNEWCSGTVTGYKCHRDTFFIAYDDNKHKTWVNLNSGKLPYMIGKKISENGLVFIPTSVINRCVALENECYSIFSSRINQYVIGQIFVGCDNSQELLTQTEGKRLESRTIVGILGSHQHDDCSVSCSSFVSVPSLDVVEYARINLNEDFDIEEISAINLIVQSLERLEEKTVQEAKRHVWSMFPESQTKYNSKENFIGLSVEIENGKTLLDIGDIDGVKKHSDSVFSNTKIGVKDTTSTLVETSVSVENNEPSPENDALQIQNVDNEFQLIPTSDIKTSSCSQQRGIVESFDTTSQMFVISFENDSFQMRLSSEMICQYFQPAISLAELYYRFYFGHPPNEHLMDTPETSETLPLNTILRLCKTTLISEGGLCRHCDRQFCTAFGDAVKCCNCQDEFHPACVEEKCTVGASLFTENQLFNRFPNFMVDYEKLKTYVCSKCKTCDSCKKHIADFNAGTFYETSVFRVDFLCQECYVLFDHDHFCGGCHKTWRTHDPTIYTNPSEYMCSFFDTKDFKDETSLLLCGGCDSWVHIDCDDDLSLFYLTEEEKAEFYAKILNSQHTAFGSIYYCNACRRENMLKILEELACEDRLNLFHMPVTSDIAPLYPKYIKHPMDLRTMLLKIMKNKYSSTTKEIEMPGKCLSGQLFRNDFELICFNAVTFNARDPKILKEAWHFYHIGTEIFDRAARSFMDSSAHDTLGPILFSKPGEYSNTLQSLELKQMPARKTEEENHLPFGTSSARNTEVNRMKDDKNKSISASNYQTELKRAPTPHSCISRLPEQIVAGNSTSAVSSQNSLTPGIAGMPLAIEILGGVRENIPMSKHAAEGIAALDLCIVCGCSDSSRSDLLVCIDCGESFHPYCVGLHHYSLAYKEQTPRHELSFDIPNRLHEYWRCPNCKICELCGKCEENEEHKLLVCDNCDQGYHTYCLLPKIRNIPNGHWYCGNCVNCETCKNAEVLPEFKAYMWSKELHQCKNCMDTMQETVSIKRWIEPEEKRRRHSLQLNSPLLSSQMSQGSIPIETVETQPTLDCCPICHTTWAVGGESIQCDHCMIWIHAACDGLDMMQFVALSEMSSSVYYCQFCRGSQSHVIKGPRDIGYSEAGWKLARAVRSIEKLRRQIISLWCDKIMIKKLEPWESMWTQSAEACTQVLQEAKTLLEDIDVGKLGQKHLVYENTPSWLRALAARYVRFCRYGRGPKRRAALSTVDNPSTLAARTTGAAAFIFLCRIQYGYECTNPIVTQILKRYLYVRERNSCKSERFTTTKGLCDPLQSSSQQKVGQDINKEVAANNARISQAQALIQGIRPNNTKMAEGMETEDKLDRRGSMDSIAQPVIHLSKSSVILSESTKVDDPRVCHLCKLQEDREGGPNRNFCGRLLFVAFDCWIHLFCLVWTHEAYETSKGVIVNWDKAKSRAKRTRCILCHQLGASVNCSSANCDQKYHFYCALKSRMYFLENKQVVCYDHWETSTKLRKISVLRLPVSILAVRQLWENRKRRVGMESTQSPSPVTIERLHNDTSSPELISGSTTDMTCQKSTESKTSDEEMEFTSQPLLISTEKIPIERSLDDSEMNMNWSTHFLGTEPLRMMIACPSNKDYIPIYSSKTRSLSAVPRNKLRILPNHNHLHMPTGSKASAYRLGSLTVYQLGHINLNANFHYTPDYVFPIGYHSTRIYWSTKHIGKRCIYHCHIVHVPTEPKRLSTKPTYTARFFIYAEEPNVEPIVAISSEKAVEELRRRIAELYTNVLPTNPFLIRRSWKSYGLTGHHFFGYGIPCIMKLIEFYLAPEIAVLGFHPSTFTPRNESTTTRNTLSTFPYQFSFCLPSKEDIEHAYHIYQSILRLEARTTSSTGSMRTDGFHHGTISPRRRTIIRRPAAQEHEFNMDHTLDYNASQQFENNGGGNNAHSTLHYLPIPMQYREMRKKPFEETLEVKRSHIHGYGLFTKEKIEAGKMVVEYQGEVINQKIADYREKLYEEYGIGSCYMFRLDKEKIIDATWKGNIARFINHSCDPKAFARVITVDGNEKKIAIFAKKVLMPGDEITYDYKFNFEEEAIRCDCGAGTCHGRMN